MLDVIVMSPLAKKLVLWFFHDVMLGLCPFKPKESSNIRVRYWVKIEFSFFMFKFIK